MPRKKEYNEDLVTEKAMQLFWANGYETTSARMLEKCMGINRFSIYSSFANKEGVLLASVKRYKRLVKKELLETLTKGPKTIDHIKKFFYDFLHFVKYDEAYRGCLLINTAKELVDSIPPKVAIEIAQFSEEIMNAFIEIIEEDKNLSPDLVKKEANYLFVALQGLMLSAKMTTQAQIDNYIELTFRSL